MSTDVFFILSKKTVIIIVREDIMHRKCPSRECSRPIGILKKVNNKMTTKFLLSLCSNDIDV